MTVRRLLIFSLYTVALLFLQMTAFGQPGDPGGNPDNPVPITGIEYLVGGGILYGVRSLLKSRKKQGD